MNPRHHMLPTLGLTLALLACPAAFAAEPLFELALDSCSYGGAAIDDLDGDGDVEVLFGTYYNDERVIALHGDGELAWTRQSSGGPVDNSVTVADLDGDGSPEVLWGDSGYTDFHVTDAAGNDLWTFVAGEVLDAPEAIGDVNGDGLLDVVLASCGGLRAFTGISGELLWSAEVPDCYQSAPLLFDQDGDGLLDVVVSTWFDSVVRGFSGLDGSLRWESAIADWTYHAGSFGDLTGDGVPDVALGDYSGTLFAIDGADGTPLWNANLGEYYIFGPTAMGDLDGDDELEIAVAGNKLQVFSAGGVLQWSTPLPGYCTRGPVLLDQDGDGLPDVLCATDGPAITVYSGLDGAVLWAHEFDDDSGQDFHPAVWDLDGDGGLDVFTVFGRGYSDPDPENNWGVAVALPLGGSGPGWPTFSHDHHHSGNYEYPPGAGVNDPDWNPGGDDDDDDAADDDALGDGDGLLQPGQCECHAAARSTPAAGAGLLVLAAALLLRRRAR